MGVDVAILLDVGIPSTSSSDALERLSTTYDKVRAIWDASYSTPTNAGFRGLDIDLFKKEYSQNWRLKDGNETKQAVNSGINPHQLTGPYGFSASLFRDALILDHPTRWIKFKGDNSVRCRLVETASIFGKALLSRHIIFLPDSGHRESKCLDHFWEGHSFDDALQCIHDAGGVLAPIDSRYRTEKFHLDVVKT